MSNVISINAAPFRRTSLQNINYKSRPVKGDVPPYMRTLLLLSGTHGFINILKSDTSRTISLSAELIFWQQLTVDQKTKLFEHKVREIKEYY